MGTLQNFLQYGFRTHLAGPGNATANREGASTQPANNTPGSPSGETTTSAQHNWTEERLSTPPLEQMVKLKKFREELGQGAAFLEGTLRQKLAEYGVSRGASVELTRDEAGQFRLGGNIAPVVAKHIEGDLNKNEDFRQVFVKVANQRPTLDYLQNVQRLQSTYGGENRMASTLISQNPQQNSLQDIGSRLSSLQNHTSPHEVLGSSRDFTIAVGG